MSTIKKQQTQAIEAVAGQKINPFSLKRPPTVIKTYTFQDSNVDQTFQLTLKRLDPAELIHATELAETFCDRYLGSFDDQGQPVMPRQLFPIVDGQPVSLSRLLIQSAAMLWMMIQDCGEDGEKLYTVEDIVGFSVVMPEAWMKLGTAMAEVQGGGPKNLKEPTGSK